jgi:hypothetical protein
MSFETAIRNPERYKEILSAMSPFVGSILTDERLLQIVSSLYMQGVVSSDSVVVEDDSTIESISASVVAVNSTRRADGGFPCGYQSRFWTYMRTLSELGFVYAQYNEPLRFSEITQKMIHNEIDEQEAFSLQAMKYNRKSPYRNVLNDFNYFKFILEVLKRKERISYEQFIISTFSEDGDIDVFLNTIENNAFDSISDVEMFVRNRYKTTNNSHTVLRDYPDTVLRLLTITGFISIQFRGKVFIYRNLANDEYINKLLDINVELTVEEKSNPNLYFTKLETYNTVLLDAVRQITTAETDGFEYSRKVAEIIALYNLNEDIIVKGIRNIGITNTAVMPEFKYIAEPLKLEFYLSLIIALRYGSDFAIKPNYKADYIGLPVAHAPGIWAISKCIPTRFTG